MSGPVKKIAVRPTSRASALHGRHPARSRARAEPSPHLSLESTADGSSPSHHEPTSHEQGEAAKASGLLGNIAKVLPWKITGPASGAEWKEVPIGATEYRVTAPA